MKKSRNEQSVNYYKRLAVATFAFIVFAYAGDQSWAKFSDDQISAMTPYYFERQTAPLRCFSANLYKHPQKGKIFQVNVRSNRNREMENVVQSFQVLVELLAYFKEEPVYLVVVLHSTSKGAPPIICRSETACSSNFFSHKTMDYNEWYSQCLIIEKTGLF
tara:strand:- start:250 stop:732 length:483 start_codon:yes stop_codon:yes gene_type:complete